MIHGDHPFATPAEEREPVRRLRGRLAAPVTIVTSGEAGLTVSSLFVVEGEPPVAYLLVGVTSDLWAEIAATGRFVIHICDDSHRSLAEVFAGVRPSPGGMLAAADVTESDWGPVLAELGDRAFCTLVSQEETGYSGLVVGRIDHVEVTDLEDPLLHFRGRYRRISGS